MCTFSDCLQTKNYEKTSVCKQKKLFTFCMFADKPFFVNKQMFSFSVCLQTQICEEAIFYKQKKRLLTCFVYIFCF